MINLRLGSMVGVTFLLITCGCKKNEPGFSHDQLNGRWELNWAQVNGSETDRLRDLYFVFLPDSSMQTNILGSERNFKYSLDGAVISQMSDPVLSYLLSEVNDSVMTVQSEIRGSLFTIYLEKAKPTISSQL